MLNRISGLYLALDEVAKCAPDLDKKRAEDLSLLVRGGRDVLQELDFVLAKHGALSSKPKGLGAKGQKLLSRLKWDQEKLLKLKDRVVLHNTNLNLFLSSITR